MSIPGRVRGNITKYKLKIVETPVGELLGIAGDS